MPKSRKPRKSAKAPQQSFDNRKYIIERARTLPLGKCYCNGDFGEESTSGLTSIIVTRLHSNGKIVCGFFLVDRYCLGLKDTFAQARMDPHDIDDYLEDGEYEPCDYVDAHNMILVAIEFAQEAGIEPHPDFEYTQYVLEDDTDEIPLKEFEYGLNGKHFFVAKNEFEAHHYLPIIQSHLDADSFDYIDSFDSFDEEEFDHGGVEVFDDDE